MNEFIQQAATYNEGEGLSWLADFQKKQSEQWATQSLPNRKTENWKYTNLKPLEQGGYFNQRPAFSSVGASEFTQLEIPGFDAIDLVFVNGGFNEALSTPLSQASAEGVTLCRFSDADVDQQALIKEHLGKTAKSEGHLFANLNGGSFSDGVFLHVTKNTRFEKPVRVVYASSSSEACFSVAQRLLVVLETGSEATVVEQYISDEGKQNVFTHGITELELGENSKLYHYRLNQEQEDAIHIGGVHVSLERSAVIESFYLALGSTINRTDVVVNYLGEGAHSEINGVYLPQGKQLVDYHTCIEHAVPHCTSNEVFRGIVGDNAKAVFNGRIHIHKDAQKTLAQLSNKNLLTSNKAEVDTKPELEIYADDVQCAHGATVAQLDLTSLHYLKTRGVSEEVAHVMLSFGFINELINTIRHEDIAYYLRPLIAKLFSRDESLLRHLDQ